MTLLLFSILWYMSLNTLNIYHDKYILLLEMKAQWMFILHFVHIGPLGN